MSGVSWQGALDRAATEQDVMRVVRDFVASLDAFELAKLPQACRPGKFFDAQDVNSFAFDVVRHQCEDQEPARELVHKIAAFFSHASTRLSQILARPSTASDEQLRSA